MPNLQSGGLINRTNGKAILQNLQCIPETKNHGLARNKCTKCTPATAQTASSAIGAGKTVPSNFSPAPNVSLWFREPKVQNFSRLARFTPNL